MKKGKDNRGFTLVEIIMALAIIALIVTAFSQLFVQSYKTIFDSGRDWTVQYKIQQQIESGHDIEDTKISDDPLSIVFPGTPTYQISAAGKTYQIQQTAGKRQITIDYFRLDK